MKEIKKDAEWINKQIDHYIEQKDFKMARAQARYHNLITGFDVDEAIKRIDEAEIKGKPKKGRGKPSKPDEIKDKKIKTKI